MHAGQFRGACAAFRLVACGLVLVLIAGCATRATVSRTATGDDFGVLVMAHGGRPPWNESVLGAVAPLWDKYRLEVAFGMADAAAIQQAVERLEARGARRIGVVRLFVSGESWYGRTRQILGLAPGAPERLPASITDSFRLRVS